ncbi:hypothetical protein FB451DRAFT_1440040 [Mycena latifolia]|nr:hypothetical protein FB451DRAFT_1434752 [Mycena latifolia]KAJ7483664.1 hypothetical protein FB451DRAFT_1440040 [Mycena latifolia]
MPANRDNVKQQQRFSPFSVRDVNIPSLSHPRRVSESTLKATSRLFASDMIEAEGPSSGNGALSSQVSETQYFAQSGLDVSAQSIEDSDPYSAQSGAEMYSPSPSPPSSPPSSPPLVASGYPQIKRGFEVNSYGMVRRKSLWEHQRMDWNEPIPAFSFQAPVDKPMDNVTQSPYHIPEPVPLQERHVLDIKMEPDLPEDPAAMTGGPSTSGNVTQCEPLTASTLSQLTEFETWLVKTIRQTQATSESDLYELRALQSETRAIEQENLDLTARIEQIIAVCGTL